METFRSLFIIGLLTVSVLSIKGQEVKSYKDTQVIFEVLSATLMGPEEQIRKQSDNIGIDVSVKMRLSNTGRTTVFFYTFGKKSTSPYGHIIKESGRGLVWFTGLQSLSDNPLGIDKLTLQSGDWFALVPEMAIEYESFDSSVDAGKKHAQTFFMKVGGKSAITQVFSDFYTVPTNTERLKNKSERSFRYVIFSNLIQEFDDPKLNSRNIGVLIDEKAFSENNLVRLFYMLSKRYPEPEFLDVSVYTNLEQTPTPEEMDQGFTSENEDSTGDHYPWAVYIRNDSNEFFNYTPIKGKSDIKSVDLFKKRK
ncbi:MAG: hypothetical protein R2747_17085 [Pyrinomonadaceae bacterium]